MHFKNLVIMKNGKRICTALKQVRKEIADANGIPYEVTECKHKGECKGTCPKCEQELRYIENQLTLRRAAGVAVTIAGISLGVASAYAATNPVASSPIQPPSVPVAADEAEYVIRGVIRYAGDSTEMAGCSVLIKGSSKGVITGMDGAFALPVNALPVTLQINYIGMKTKEIIVTVENYADLGDIIIEDDEEALGGDVVMVGAVEKRSPMQRLKHRIRRIFKR